MQLKVVYTLYGIWLIKRNIQFNADKTNAYTGFI